MKHAANPESYRAHAFQGVDLSMCRLLGLLANLEDPAPDALLPRLRRAATMHVDHRDHQTGQLFTDILQETRFAARRAIDCLDRNLINISNVSEVPATGLLHSSALPDIHQLRLIRLELVRPKRPEEIGEDFVTIPAHTNPTLHAGQYIHAKIGARLPGNGPDPTVPATQMVFLPMMTPRGGGIIRRPTIHV